MSFKNVLGTVCELQEWNQEFEFSLFSFTIRNTNMAADVTMRRGGGNPKLQRQRYSINVEYKKYNA